MTWLWLFAGSQAMFWMGYGLALFLVRASRQEVMGRCPKCGTERTWWFWKEEE